MFESFDKKVRGEKKFEGDSQLKLEFQKFYNFLSSESFNPEQAIELIKKHFSDVFDSSVGVWEGYTLAEHTVMVVRQFEKYFANRPLPAGIQLADMRLILIFHDIGKPEAVRQGNKHLQHKYTQEIIRDYFPKVGVANNVEKLAIALISGDPFADYVRGNSLIEETVQEIVALANDVGLSINDFYNLLLIFYRVDAGSYTLDSGGKESLDRLFVFDHDKMELHFASTIEEKEKQLRSMLLAINE